MAKDEKDDASHRKDDMKTAQPHQSFDRDAPRGPLTVEVIDRLNDLARWRDSWDRLVFESSYYRPTMSATWVISFLEHCLQPGERWVCLIALRGDELMGLLPLIISSARVIGMRQPHLRAPHDLETNSVEILTFPELHQEIAAKFFSTLDQVVPGWFTCRFTRLPDLSPLLSMAGQRQSAFRIMPDLNGWGSYLPVVGKFDEYFRGLSKNFRRNLKKAERKLADVPHVETIFVQGRDAGDHHFTDFIHLESAGWKGRKGTAISNAPRNLDFYRSLTERVADSGHLEWHFLRSGDRPIAGHLAIRTGRRLTIPKIAYDESYARCAPGNMLFVRMLKQLFARDDIDEVDCLTDMTWHANWRMSRRPYYDVRIFPRRALPTLCGVWPLAVKDLVRSMPGVRQLKQLLRR